jgi:hypothetical protein
MGERASTPGKKRRSANEEEAVTEELRKAHEMIYGPTDREEDDSNSGHVTANAFTHIKASRFEELGLDKQEYIYWLTNENARERLLSYAKTTYNNENIEFITAGIAYLSHRRQCADFILILGISHHMRCFLSLRPRLPR